MYIFEACQRFLAYAETTKKLSPHTIRAYRQDLEAFNLATDTQQKIIQVDKQTIQDFIHYSFDKGLSQATVKRRVACLKALFKWLESEEVIEDTPFRKLDLKIRLPHKLPRNLSTQELNKLLKIARKHLKLTRSSTYQAADFENISKSNINHLTTLVCIELLFTTGVRVGELTEITLTDIYIHEQYIHIKGKGQRERRVFITDKSIYNLIQTYLKFRSITQPNHEVFLVNSRGQPATTQTVRIWLKKCSQQAKLTRTATPHMYRHATATELLSSGVDITYVQKLLGHQSISTTQIYTHINHRELFKNVVKANIRKEIL